MEITRTVPVTIDITVSGRFCNDCRFCQRYKCLLFWAVLHRTGKLGEVIQRCPACLAEFAAGVEDETDCK
jgi:hypothetical protein